MNLTKGSQQEANVRSRSMKRWWGAALAACSTALLVACGGGGGGDDEFVSMKAGQGAPLPGAIWTTEVDCTTTNHNIYSSKQAVYLNGGPVKNGPGLPDGMYWARATAPSGNPVLGVTNGATVEVSGGRIVSCLKLWDILFKTSDGTQGYDNTPNHGGVYKVWLSTTGDFTNSSTKTDNFRAGPDGPPPDDPDPTGRVIIKKWYDANANGVKDGGEVELTGWKVDLLGRAPQNTEADYPNLPLEDQTAREYLPTQNNWLATNAYVDNHSANAVSGNLDILNQINVPLSEQKTSATVYFGNVCLGAGGGKTLGFWSNKNGERTMNSYGMASALAQLSGLNLRTAGGGDFDPTSYSQFRTWLLGGTATNMAYMLSVQLAAMKLNVLTGGVSGAAMVYAPGTPSANGMGFISINALMNDANTSLGLYGNTPSGHEQRTVQGIIKDALDDANNNLNFVQANPCAYSFAQ